MKNLICSDLDETYIPFDPNNKPRSGVRELEGFLNENIDDLSLLIGWVTGSNLESVLRKAKGYSTHLPHFIASTLGTELYWVKELLK